MSSRADLARTLLRKAANDEFVLRRLASDENAPDDALGFHAQQAIEKLLKAALASRGIAYEFSHDLNYLAELARRSGLEPPAEPARLDALTGYAVPLRYDDPLDEPPLDRDAASELVGSIRAWAARVVEDAAEPEEADPSASTRPRR